MKDVQSAADTRGIPIDRVGITKLCYPIGVKSRDGDLFRPWQTFRCPWVFRIALKERI